MLKTLLTRSGLLTLLLAAAFASAACGGAGDGQQGSGSGEQETAEKTGDASAGMDNDQMGHGSMGMGSGDMARQMVMENGEYSDERFIDAMIPHHESAIEMARVAQDKSDIPEIQDLSRNIIDAQQREISQMQGWRERWYPRG